MSTVKVVERLEDGLCVISYEGQRAMWSRRKLRNTRTCGATEARLAKGEEHYAPVGNMQYRSRRLSRGFVEEAQNPHE